MDRNLDLAAPDRSIPAAGFLALGRGPSERIQRCPFCSSILPRADRRYKRRAEQDKQCDNEYNCLTRPNANVLPRERGKPARMFRPGALRVCLHLQKEERGVWCFAYENGQYHPGACQAGRGEYPRQEQNPVRDERSFEQQYEQSDIRSENAEQQHIHVAVAVDGSHENALENAVHEAGVTRGVNSRKFTCEQPVLFFQGETRERNAPQYRGKSDGSDNRGGHIDSFAYRSVQCVIRGWPGYVLSDLVRAGRGRPRERPEARP